jgi:carbon-monoxide dehydrogenase small subunit
MTWDAPLPHELRFSVNGSLRTCLAPPDRRLADILREEFGLTAVRTACEVGRCGACMVLWNDRPVNACLVMAWQLDGASIVTAEGLDAYPEARILKQALAQENAFQCGYCASGFVVVLTAALREHGRPGPDAIRRALEGNICRCTGYYSILRGAERAVEMLAQDTESNQDHDRS